MYFCFCSFSHSYGSFNRDIFNILDLLWVSCTLFIHIFTLFIHRKSFCTFICQVAPLTSSCQFSTFHPCSLLPQASSDILSSSFLRVPPQDFIWLVQRLLILLPFEDGETHIAKSSSLTIGILGRNVCSLNSSGKLQQQK